MRENRGLIYSSMLHGIILILLIFGLPSFLHHDIDEEPAAVSVEILPIAQMSNVKPQEAQPEETKKPIADRNTERKAAPEVKQEEVKNDQPPPMPLPEKKLPKPEKKKPEKKKPEKKKQDNPLDAVLNDVKQHAKMEESDKPTRTKSEPNAKPAKSTHYDPGAPLSLSQRDAIVQQINSKWNAPVGAKDAQNLVVTLHITMNSDGSVSNVELAEDKARYYSDSFFRAAVDSAIRAVHLASPLKNLPADKYNVRDGWSDMELTFNPHDAL
jgi:outer membrane biosynthesis protein TonB